MNGKLVVPLVREEKVIELLAGDDEDRLTGRYTDEALEFMSRNRERPFFLYLPHTAVHVPIHPGEKFRGHSKNGRFGDWVEEVDWSVGRVLDSLRDLKLAENTLVIFSSDNGPWLEKGTDGGEAGPLRGGKGSTWEGGVREPTLAWWPGKIAPGSVCAAVAGNIDFLPTFVKLAGGAVPTDRKIDGRDISPLLLGATRESPREAHYYYANYKLQAVRAGPWKLTIAPQPAGTTKNGPMIPASPEKPRLYNLDEEIGERTDVAPDHPDVVARLKALAVKMAADIGDGKPGPGVRPAGRVENPVTLYPVVKDPIAVAKATKTSMRNLEIGDSVGEANAPQVARSPITVACEVETTARNGVIVAQGGIGVGYALYLKDGHLVFAVRRSADGVTRIVSGGAFSGHAKIEARLAADGTMTLAIDGGLAARGNAGGLLGNQPIENFCVGRDDGLAVDEEEGKTPFQGAIRHLTVSTEAKK